MSIKGKSNPGLSSSLILHCTKAFSWRRRCPEGADEVENVSNSPYISINTQHFTAHLISLAPLDSFSSRRSLGPYHAFDLLDKSEFAAPM